MKKKWNVKCRIFGIVNYLVLLFAAIGALLFYHNYVMLLLLAVIVLTPVFSAGSAYFISRRLKVSVDIRQTSVARQHTVKLDILTENPTWFSVDSVVVAVRIYNAFYGNDEIVRVTVPATARETRTLSWDFSSSYCGRIIVHTESVKVKDMLNIFTFSCRGELAEAEVFVMPEVRKIDMQLEMLSEGEGEQPEVQYRKGSDVSEISEIREYIPGDKLQMIHWKISAKQDKMMVKEYSMPYTNEFILIPELYYDGENPSVMDEILDVLYSYAYIFLKQQRKFYVGWLNGATGEVFSVQIESELDIASAMKQIFYARLEKHPLQAKEHFGHAGKYEGRTVVYVGKAVVECLS